MVLCIVALAVFSVLGLWSVRYRRLAKESFQCVFQSFLFRPCVTKLDERIKARLTAKIVPRSQTLARFVYRNFKILSWIFTVSFFASLIYSLYGIGNLLLYGTCTPGSACVLGQPDTLGLIIQVLTCYEAQIVYGIIAVAVIIALFVLYWKRK